MACRTGQCSTVVERLCPTPESSVFVSPHVGLQTQKNRKHRCGAWAVLRVCPRFISRPWQAFSESNCSPEKSTPSCIVERISCSLAPGTVANFRTKYFPMQNAKRAITPKRRRFRIPGQKQKNAPQLPVHGVAENTLCLTVRPIPADLGLARAALVKDKRNKCTSQNPSGALTKRLWLARPRGKRRR